jgi:hypothetical protein
MLSKTVDSEGVGIHYDISEKPFTGKDVAQLERLMAEKNIYLIWSGHITPDMGKEVISFTETKLTEDDTESNMRKRVFSILVEILENVAKHGIDGEEAEKYGMPVAMIRFENKTYTITTGNLIANENVDHLKEKLDTINQCDQPGLKELFRKSLTGQNDKSVSTGNMGLIDMARKSGNKLIYEFDRINNLYSYYILAVTVEGKDN